LSRGFVQIFEFFGGIMFYEIFKQLCKDRGISPSKASDEIGFSRGSVSYWKKKYERGEDAKPDSYTAAKIADYFRVSVDYLLGRTEDPIDYDQDGEALAEIPLNYVEAANGDMKRARAIMLAADIDAQLEEQRKAGNLGRFSKSDAALVFALWGSTENIDEKDLEDVKRFAEFIKEKKENK